MLNSFKTTLKLITYINWVWNTFNLIWQLSIDRWIQLSNCVLSLMLHKCHTSYLSDFTDLSWCAKWFTISTECCQTLPCIDNVYPAHSVIKRRYGRRQFLLSLQGQQRKVSFYQSLMVNKRKIVSTKFTRQPKDFTKFIVLTEFRWLTQEIVSEVVFTKQGRPVKEYVNLWFNA